MFKHLWEIRHLPIVKINSRKELEKLFNEYGKVKHAWFVYDLSWIKDELNIDDYIKLQYPSSDYIITYPSWRTAFDTMAIDFDKDPREYKFTLDGESIYKFDEKTKEVYSSYWL